VTSTSSTWISGPVIATIITGLVALLMLVVNQYQARQDARRMGFAEALAAVERYAELPYRILHRQGSTLEVRGSIVEFIHEVQQDLLFRQSWTRIQVPRVADVYDSLLRTKREEADSAMTKAWGTAAITADENMPLKVGLSFPRMAEERIKYIEAVKYELEFSPLRWIRDHLIPWLADRLDIGSNER
jgi:hypothetical protein